MLTCLGFGLDSKGNEVLTKLNMIEIVEARYGLCLVEYPRNMHWKDVNPICRQCMVATKNFTSLMKFHN